MNQRDKQYEHDIGRMKRLEGDLQRLVAAVDARLSEPVNVRRPVVTSGDDLTWRDLVTSWSGRQIAVIFGLGALLFTSGWIGSGLYYSSLIQHKVESELRPYAEELAGTVAAIQTDLAPRMAIADELKAEIDQARRDLLGRDDELQATIAEAQGQLLGIRDSAIDDIERRLSDQTDDLSLMLEASRKRAMELDQGLGDVAQALAAFDRQLPMLTDGFDDVATGLMRAREVMDAVSQEVASLDGKAPTFLESLDKHRLALDNGTKTLSIVRAQLEALKTQTTRSSQQLDHVLNEGRGRIEAWEDADREIATRKEGIMRNLDQYADSLNARVREFIEALNVEPTFTGG